MARYRAEDLAVETKPDLTPVSESDKAVELALRERLGDARPDDTVIGEEFGGAELAGEPGRAWVIDPIDGTKSYVRGMDTWTTLIALLEDGEVKLGVVSMPALEQALVGGARARARSPTAAGSTSRRSPS